MEWVLTLSYKNNYYLLQKNSSLITIKRRFRPLFQEFTYSDIHFILYVQLRKNRKIFILIFVYNTYKYVNSYSPVRYDPKLVTQLAIQR